MDNQHQKISGYRELTQDEIDLMNLCKGLAAECGYLIDTMAAREGLDQRSIALAKTNLQQGFMWMIRGVAQPTTFG